MSIGARRAQVLYAVKRGVSQRQACGLMSVSRSTPSFVSRLGKRDREALAIDAAGSIRSGRVIEILSRLISERGAPKALRSDNGPEFVPTRLLQRAADGGVACVRG